MTDILRYPNDKTKFLNLKESPEKRFKYATQCDFCDKYSLTIQFLRYKSVNYCRCIDCYNQNKDLFTLLTTLREREKEKQEEQ